MEDKKTSKTPGMHPRLKKKDLRHQFFAPSAKSTPPKINHVNGKKTGEVSELTKDRSSATPAHYKQFLTASPQLGKRVREEIDITG